MPGNPWVFGGRVSHPAYRYSCQHHLLEGLQSSLRSAFTGNSNAPLPDFCLARILHEPTCCDRRYRPVCCVALRSLGPHVGFSYAPASRTRAPCIQANLAGLATVSHEQSGHAEESVASAARFSPVEYSAQRHNRPVSYYAFFKGWLLLSQPPGCL